LLDIGRAASNDCVVGGVIIVDLEFGEPLEGEGRPIHRVQQQKIIVVWRFLLPNLVLLIYDHLLLFVKLYIQP
jgi:hypothetical protein